MVCVEPFTTMGYSIYYYTVYKMKMIHVSTRRDHSDSLIQGAPNLLRQCGVRHVLQDEKRKYLRYRKESITSQQSLFVVYSKQY